MKGKGNTVLMKTRILLDKAAVGITLLPPNQRNIVMDDPRISDFALGTVAWWYWDADQLRAGRREFLGVEITDVATLKESDFAAIERLDLPRIDCSEIDLPDTTIVEVLRWARRKYISSPEAFDQSRKALGTGPNRFATRPTGSR